MCKDTNHRHGSGEKAAITTTKTKREPQRRKTIVKTKKRRFQQTRKTTSPGQNGMSVDATASRQRLHQTRRRRHKATLNTAKRSRRLTGQGPSSAPNPRGVYIIIIPQHSGLMKPLLAETHAVGGRGHWRLSDPFEPCLSKYLTCILQT